MNCNTKAAKRNSAMPKKTKPQKKSVTKKPLVQQRRKMGGAVAHHDHHHHNDKALTQKQAMEKEFGLTEAQMIQHDALANRSPPTTYALEAHTVGSIHSPPSQPGQFMIPGHTLRVKKLYRKMLRDHFNWYGLQYDNWITHAGDLREEFEKNRNLTDAGQIETVIREAEVYLHETEDPGPYRPLMHPQGGLWGRNEAPSRELLKPPPSTFVADRDYHEEERVVRHLHAVKGSEDHVKDNAGYAKLKVLRGEYWFDPQEPGTYNPVVAEYCEMAGIPFMPDPEEVSASFMKSYIANDENQV